MWLNEKGRVWVCVALLAEGVDRNLNLVTEQIIPQRVALLAEGVDRNYKEKAGLLRSACRPPRGGRG